MSTELSDPTATVDPTNKLKEEHMSTTTTTTEPAVLYVRMITVAIRRALKAAGMTQARLSKATGIPLPTLSRRLSDSGRPWLMSELLAVAEALGTTAAALADEAEHALGSDLWLSAHGESAR